MNPGEHIFQWARNDQTLYKRMMNAQHFPTIAKAQAAAGIASSALRDMHRCGEIIPGKYSSSDILDAAKRICGWDGDE